MAKQTWLFFVALHGYTTVFMGKKLLFSVVFQTVFLAAALAQEWTGTVFDEKNAPLIGATVYWKSAKQGTTTQDKGRYTLTAPPDRGDSLCFSFLGYRSQCFAAKAIPQKGFTVTLQTTAVTTQEVEITGQRSEAIRSAQMSTTKMDLKQIEELPAFMGEVDVLKSIQLLPGVQSAGEGNSGFYVRGGGPDQNLILLDKAPVYNASHLLGLFSVFNHNAIGDPTLIKGGMPAQYGNRLSSVLHVPSKDGNLQEHQFGGGIGLIASRFHANGPIVKDKVSYMVAARRTYIDAIADPFIPNDARAKGSGYFFYDLNAKVTAKLSKKDVVEVSLYQGDDVFNFVNNRSDINIRIPWGNTVVQANYERTFSADLKADFYGYYNQYDFALQSQFDQFTLGINSKIEDYSAGSDWYYSGIKYHNIQFGVQTSRNKYLPTYAEASSAETTFDTGDRNPLYSNQLALYVQDEWTVSPLLKIQAGLRYSLFQHIGPFKRFLEPEGGNTLSNVKLFGRGDVIAAYQGLEPRLSMRLAVTEFDAIKASFTKNYQYLHLASISPVSLPTDIWIPSSSIIKPQEGYQYAVGYFKNLPDWKSEFSLELYYKDMYNLVEYKDNTNPEDNINNNVDNQLTQGRGYSYGAEFFLKRKYGNFNGWLGYTYSITRRRFDDINEGREFPAKYDRTHDLSLVGTYKLNEKWTFGANFIFGTGNAISLPTSRYFSFLDGRVLSVYEGRNTFRMPNYHRFDVSATYRPEPKPDKKWRHWWTFSLYNVYSRQNPYFLYFDVEGNIASNNLDLNAKQVSLFPILPSVTWNFEF